MDNRLNRYKYPGAKRLMLEALELKDTTEDYCAQPIDDNLFEWHFTVKGPPDTAFEGGYYHGMLSFPTEYPMKPPSIILLTPNGRFETNKKICLSISGYHPETWQPSWSVRTALVALIAFMPTKSKGAIGALEYPDTERRRLARKSRTWSCPTCGVIKDLLAHPNQPATNKINSPKAHCEPSSSRVGDQEESNRKHSHKSEDQDNQRSLLEATGSSLSDQQEAVAPPSPSEAIIDQHSPDPSPSAKHETTLSRSDVQSPTSEQLHEERRRDHFTTLCLKSIFLLLSLLILRRVVLVIQS